MNSSSRIRNLFTALEVALFTAFVCLSVFSSTAMADNAADVAKKPVVPPKPYRLRDGHPNWTGFWVPMAGLLENDIGLGGSLPGTAPPPTSMPFSGFSKLKSPYKEERQRLIMQIMKNGQVADPVAACFPPGFPRMMVMIYGMEFLQTPGQITMTSEWDEAARRVWLDQKTHTNPDELDPTYTGESIGHWEGDTLVVDTVGIRLDVPVDYVGLRHSDKLHVVERWTEKVPGILIDEITIDDPEVFETPWKEIETYRYRPDLRLKEFVCLENNRNVGPHGEATFTN